MGAGGDVASAAASAQFGPSFSAGTLSSRAGAFSPETVTIARGGEEEEFGRIELRNAPGLLGMLSRAGVCPEAEAGGSCPANSQIGTVTVGLEPLGLPIRSEGGVYLTGPYGGAPFGLSVDVPILAGLLDLGEVVVRAKLEIDPATAVLSIASDPLPRSLAGVALHIRSIHLDLNRRGFIVNPTSCRASSIAATLTSVGGATASEQSRFRATDCGRLSFRPALALRLRGSTHHAAHPRLTVNLKMPKRGANLKGVAVTLPPDELLDSAHLREPCSNAVFAEGSTPGERCPAASVIGRARVATPLLRRPLAGAVYLRASTRRLPDLVAALRGPLRLELDGRISAVRGALRAAFAELPDAPVSSFSLRLAGGARGLLLNGADPCARPLRARVVFGGQNGAIASAHPRLMARCGGSRKKR